MKLKKHKKNARLVLFRGTDKDDEVFKSIRRFFPNLRRGTKLSPQ